MTRAYELQRRGSLFSTPDSSGTFKKDFERDAGICFNELKELIRNNSSDDEIFSHCETFLNRYLESDLKKAQKNFVVTAFIEMCRRIDRNSKWEKDLEKRFGAFNDQIISGILTFLRKEKDYIRVAKLIPEDPFSVKLEIIPFINLTFSKPLGKGSYGEVFKGTCTSHGVVAIKMLKVSELYTTDQFIDEARSMAISHPNIVRLWGVSNEPGKYCLVMELMPVSLDKFLKNEKNLNSKWHILYGIAKDVAFALSYLHSKQVIHRDIKSSNVLLSGSVAKLADFGFAGALSIQSGISGSIPWWAPELLSNPALTSFETDVYSFGMLLWELVAQKMPFAKYGEDIEEVVKAIRRKETETIPEGTPDALRDIIQRCWNLDPSARPKAEELYNDLNTLWETEIKSQEASQQVGDSGAGTGVTFFAPPPASSASASSASASASASASTFNSLSRDLMTAIRSVTKRFTT